MGKETIICVVLIIAIIVGDYITQNYTKETAEELSGKLNSLKEIILSEEGENKEILQERMGEVWSEWETRYSKLAYFIEHDELEKIENNLTGVSSFIETEEYAEAISELDKGAFVLEHIKDKYVFELENIF